jgi:cobalt-precorrin-7 (C5)-methyltransferase
LRRTFVLGANIPALLAWIEARQTKRWWCGLRRSAVLRHRNALVAHLVLRVRIIPGISAVQYLCAQAGIDMNDIWLTSSHGRSVCFDELARHRKVAMVTDAAAGRKKLPRSWWRAVRGIAGW